MHVINESPLIELNALREIVESPRLYRSKKSSGQTIRFKADSRTKQ